MKNKAGFLLIILLLLLGFKYSYSGSNPTSQPQSKWVAPATADQLKNPLTNPEDAIKEGKKTFQQLCVICHGDFGKGDGMAGASLNPRPANLTSKDVQSQTDGAIYWKITQGNPPMASYKDVLSATQRWQLVDFIRTLKKK